MPHPLRAVAAWLLGAVFLPAIIATAEPLPDATSYDARIATAHILTVEGSHALAHAEFKQALALAPDKTQRRWCEIWALQQELAADSHHITQARVRHEAAILLEPYEKDGVPRDELWAATKTLMPPHLGTRLELAEFWAAQPLSPAAVKAFADAAIFLGRLLCGRAFREDAPQVSDALLLLKTALDSPALHDTPARGARFALCACPANAAARTRHHT